MLDYNYGTILYYLALMLVSTFISQHFYSKIGRNVVAFDFDIKPHERKIYRYTLIKYFLWALVQQAIIIVPLTYWNIHPEYKVLIAIASFSIVYHTPNLRLMIATLLLGILIYPAWFLFGFDNIILVALSHAYTGTLYKFLDWNMEIWWMVPKENRWKI